MSDPKTPSGGTDLTLADAPPPKPAETLAARVGVIDRVFALPPWAVVTLGVAVLAFILARGYLKQEAAPQPVPVEIKLVQPAPAAASPDEQVVGAQARRMGPARRFFVDVARRRLQERLEKDGFALIGKDATPLTPAQAEQLVGRLSDDVIVTGAIESGAVGDGKLLDRLGAIVEWLVAHQDQILLLLKFLMTLLAFV